MSHIFISYSHKDKEYAHKLRTALQERSFDAWLDEDIAYSYGTQRWVREIEKHLQQCSAFVLVMSPDAHESDWVEKELLTAFELNKPIATLLLAGKTWFSVQNIQYVDVTNGALPPESFYINLARQQSIPPVDLPKNEIHIIGDVINSTVIAGDKNWVKNKPTVKETNPTVEESKPTVEEIKPTVKEIKPTVKEIKPTVKEIKPTVEEIKPTVEETKPTVEEIKPTIPRGRNLAGIAAILGACMILSVLSSAGIWALNGGIPILTVKPTIQTTVTDTPQPQNSATTYPTEIAQKEVPMELIPAGSFTMGSDTGNSDEKPLHDVVLNTFYMDKYEVSNALYKDCVDASKCTAPSDISSATRPSYYGNGEFYNYPVIYVDWNQAKTYCEWRGARLPTEAEWEYAARGADGRIYPWGNDADINKTHANYDGKDTNAVDSYESGKSPFGLYDMAGNVWEWVGDWYDKKYYQSSPLSNPAGPDSGQSRVVRGGSWSITGNDLRSTNRYGYGPSFGSYNLGFRCARLP